MLVAPGSVAAEAPLGAAPAEAPPGAPVLGRSETLAWVAGSVSVRPRGSPAFVPLTGSVEVPDESEVEATRGRVLITVATPAAGQTASAEAYAGRFRLHQDPVAPAETHLILSRPLASCGGARSRRRGAAHARLAAVGARIAAAAASRAAAATRAARSRASRVATASHAARSRHLWASDHGGSWGTNGRYVSTTVEGTRWLTTDECRRSKVRVAEGTVAVRDLIRNTTATVAAGHEYVAAAPPVERPGFLPPAGHVLTGVSGGDPTAFARQVGKHAAVFGYFGNWGEAVAPRLAQARALHARLLLHLSTDVGYGGSAGQSISPGAIASGRGDGFLVRLGRELARSAQPVYVALLPEMNQANNAYSAFNPSGSPRGPANSTAEYRQAWRRAVLILRGGAVAVIDRRLRALHLPPLASSASALAQPRVSFMWAPQTAGTPDTPANAPAAYYPGGAYVDIVGTDFYSAFPNFSGLQSLYSAYRTKPFGFNEWAMWRSGDPGFVRQLFAFVRAHRRFGLMVYNQGLSAGGPFRLSRFPAATAELRRQLRSPRFLAYAAE